MEHCWTRLPELVLRCILEHVNWCRATSRAFRLTCKEWQVVHDTLLPVLRPVKAPMKGYVVRKIFPNVETILLDKCQQRITTKITFSKSTLPSLKVEQFEHTLELQETIPLTDSHFSCFRGMSRLSHLTLGRNCDQLLHVSGGGRRSFAVIILERQMPNLTSLDLSHFDFILDSHLEAISHLTRLRQLDLTAPGAITDAGLSALSSLSLLTSIGFKSANVTDSGLETLTRSMKSLSSVNLHMCNSITDTGLRLLCEAHKSITSLNLRSCFEITDMGLNSLTALTNLKDLNLLGCNLVSEQGMCSLSRITSLTSLACTNCNTENSVRAIARLCELKTLKFESCQFIDEWLACLSTLRNLASISFIHCRTLNGTGLSVFSVAKGLKELNLVHCTEVDNKGLWMLQPITSLTSLNLLGCPNITNEGISLLCSFKLLKRLELIRCPKLKAGGLSIIAQITSLVSLNIQSCDGMVMGKDSVALAMLSKIEDLNLAGSYGSLNDF